MYVRTVWSMRVVVPNYEVIFGWDPTLVRYRTVVDGSTDSTQTLVLVEIEAMFVPGTETLRKPNADTKITYAAGSGLGLEITSMSAVPAKNGSNDQTNADLTELPCRICCSVDPF